MSAELREMVGDWAPQAQQVAADIGLPHEDWEDLEASELLIGAFALIQNLTGRLSEASARARAFEHAAVVREIARRKVGSAIMVGHSQGCWVQVGHDDSCVYAGFIRDQLLAGGVAACVVPPAESRFIPSLYRSREEWLALISARYAEQLAQYQQRIEAAE